MSDNNKLFSAQFIGLVSSISVITLWLLASILTHDILKEYNKPVLMTYISVASMQIYFVFLKIEDPLFTYLEAKKEKQISEKNEDAIESISMKEVRKVLKEGQKF